MQMSTEAVPGRRLLVVGWPVGGIKELVEGLRGFAAPGTHVSREGVKGGCGCFVSPGETLPTYWGYIGREGCGRYGGDAFR